MKEFKVGDRVKVVTSGYGFSPDQLGEIVTISRKGASYMDGVDGYFIEESIGNGEHGIICGVNSFKFVRSAHPNPPHRHAELIKAWADGAEIELKGFNNEWKLMGGQSIAWFNSSTYRIKPTKSAKDIKLEELQVQAQKLADEIKELQNA